MSDEYKTEDTWTIPVRGTFGSKAENLYKNTETILNGRWKISRSMVIPHEYYSLQGGIYYMLDDISKCFDNSEFVAIRSSSPDEDLGERTPGLYVSEKVRHHYRREAIDQLQRVLGSYHSNAAKRRREEKGIAETGMSLLVQEWINSECSGSFSDLGDSAILTYTDPNAGIESMIKPSLKKMVSDFNGKNNISIDYSNDYDKIWIKRFRELTNSLPQDKDRGWELEFVISKQGSYIMQTTPIKKQPKFEVKETKNNIFHNRDVIGSGIFRTNGILYLPINHELNMKEFDNNNKDYCLVVAEGVLTSASTRTTRNPLLDATNAKVLISVSPSGLFSGLDSFAAHAQTYIREKQRCGLVGRFTNEFKESMSGDFVNSKLLYLDTKLLIQADEVEQKANVEIIK
jgi:hypothetical protein